MKPTPLTVVLNKQLVSNFLEVMPFWLSALHKRFHASADGRSYAAIFSDQDSFQNLPCVTHYTIQQLCCCISNLEMSLQTFNTPQSTVQVVTLIYPLFSPQFSPQFLYKFLLKAFPRTYCVSMNLFPNPVDPVIHFTYSWFDAPLDSISSCLHHLIGRRFRKTHFIF